MSKTEVNKKMSRFMLIERDIASLLNKWSVDNDFNVPDFVLARFLMRQLRSLMDLNHEFFNYRNGNGSLKERDRLPFGDNHES